MDKEGKLSGQGMVNFLTNGPAGVSVHSTAKGQPLARLTAMLSNQLKRPVLDKTGLSGKYDFDLEFAADVGSLPPPPPGQHESGFGASVPAGNAIQPGLDLPAALQKQLGLRLVTGRANLDVLVIDKAERELTAN